MSGSTTHPMWRPLAGVAVAIAITTTMDATGLTMFSSLPLLPPAIFREREEAENSTLEMST